MDLIEQIKKEAETFHKNSKGSHGWDHTLRVYNLCLHIGKIENANLEILQISSLLHDIARSYEDKSKGQICHAKKGAELAEKILLKYNLEEEKIKEVYHSINTHRSRGDNKPLTKEAKILFDADKLDAMGAVGLGRIFLFAGEIGSKLHDKNVDINNSEEYSKDDTAYREYLIKIRFLKDKMLTNEGKRLAKERHEFMANFFDRMNKEVDGEI